MCIRDRSKPMIGKDPNKYEGRPGVTIMGDGRVVLVADINTLVD